MIKRIRRQFESVRGNKRHVFGDFDPIIRRCFREYAHLFPNRRIKKDGSKVVYHPNVEELAPISLEKEHGSREFIPYRYAKFAIQGIDDLISYIEAHPDPESGRVEGNEDSDVDESTRNETREVANAGDEDASLLREPKIPDRDS
jgi:hypothetical protein